MIKFKEDIPSRVGWTRVVGCFGNTWSPGMNTLSVRDVIFINSN